MQLSRTLGVRKTASVALTRCKNWYVLFINVSLGSNGLAAFDWSIMSNSLGGPKFSCMTLVPAGSGERATMEAIHYQLVCYISSSASDCTCRWICSLVTMIDIATTVL